MSKVDWGSIKRHTSSLNIKDIDSFLDALPINVGYNALMAAGIAWVIAAGAIFFASMETEKVSKLHASLMEVQALQPPIPQLKFTPVNTTVLKALSDKITGTYKGVSLVPSSDGTVTVTGQDTDYFPQFLASISYLQRGGKNWKTSLSKMCVGRDCGGSKLSATLKIEAVSIAEPEEKRPAEKDKDDSGSKDSGSKDKDDSAAAKK